MKKCFIVSQIGKDGSDARRQADKVFKYIIKPVCQKCEFEVIRVDQLNQPDSITETIIDYLKTSELVIADITGHNPNAFYEMGYRTSLEKPIIYLKSKEETIPFDIQNIRTFEYDLQDLDSVEIVKERLYQTISSLSFEINYESEETINGQNDSTISDLLPILYQIQDSIIELKTEIAEKDDKTLQTIMQTSLNNAAKAESSDTILMKALLPELIHNPQTLRNLIKMTKTLDNEK